jgi:3-(3-hydroxy-phenyl)propionate hydroxylase
MAAALSLDARNVPVRVLEADPEDRERPGSRAIYIHGATLETLERIHPGLGHDIADAGLVWPTRRTLWRGEEVFSRTYPNAGQGEGLPHFTSLPQVTTEAFLLEALEARDIDIAWDTAVEQVASSADGVDLTLDSGDTIEAEYVVGADGGGSTVRKDIGSTFEGSQSENSFVIVDVETLPDESRPSERVFHYEHPAVDGRDVLIVPFEGGWRVDLQLDPDDDPEAWNGEDAVAAWVGDVMGEAYADHVTWESTYRFKQVVADSFVDDDRRVLLIGEAAHLFAPFGARGMNSGIADADAAGSAIAGALRAKYDGVARAEVEWYAAQREAAAEWNTEAATQALDHLRGANPLIQVKKELAARVAPFWEPAGEWLDTAPYGPRSGPPLATGSKY